jgi:hypothetical protein
MLILKIELRFQKMFNSPKNEVRFQKMFKSQKRGKVSKKCLISKNELKFQKCLISKTAFLYGD